LANMKFIGNLFLRQLLAVKVIGQVVHDLIGLKEGLPEEHMIECVCELLRAIGFTLDNTPHGKMLMSQFAARLVDLKRSPGPDGKPLFSKRIQFSIQDLLDLRANQWQQKLFKQQAKTKAEIAKERDLSDRKQAKTNEPQHWTTVRAGERPAYIDDLKEVKPKPRKQEAAASSKPIFDNKYIMRLFQYFSDEKNAEDLCSDWQKASPSREQIKTALDTYVDAGLNDPMKEDVFAQTIVVLVTRRCIPWDILTDSIGPHVEDIENMKLDVPACDLFIHSLLSRLLLEGAREFNVRFLKAFDGCKESWSLMTGALKKMKIAGGKDAIQKALDISDFSAALCAARRCSSSELKKALQSEGI